VARRKQRSGPAPRSTVLPSASAHSAAPPSSIIAGSSGYIVHELHRCVEKADQYLLLVWWQRLEDHTVGFRGSPQYQEWRRLLHHFYDPFPTVEHYGESLVANPPATLLAQGLEHKRISKR